MNASTQPLFTLFKAGVLRARPLLMRVAFATLLVLAIGLAVAKLPEAITQWTIPCSSTCGIASLTPENVHTLEAMGIGVEQFVAFWVGVNALFSLVWAAVATLIVLRRGDDWVAVIVAIFLVTLGVGQFHFTVTEAVPHSQLWYSLEHSLSFVGNVMWGLMFAVFPDGRFVPRWSWLLVVSYGLVEAVDQLVASLDVVLAGFPLLVPLIYFVLYGGMLGVQIYRYRTVATPVQRQQTKWVVFGFSIFIVVLFGIVGLSAFVPSLYGPGALTTYVIHPFFLFAASAMPISIGIAVLRYRLWDIDIIISRTLQYALLSACVSGLYVVVVGYLGALFRAESNLAISLVATGVVAIVFQPLRAWLQRGVNRLLFGERDEPYAVIGRLGARLEATFDPEATLPIVVETVAHALKLPYVAIQLQRGTALQRAAAYGQPQDVLRAFPLIYQGTTVGWLELAPRAPGEIFTPSDERLLTMLAQHVGVAAHATQLTADLRQLADDLQVAREQLVATREEERRRLRRDLHDGVGPTLASLAQRLDMARSFVERDPALAQDMIGEVKSEVKGTIAEIRRLVYALRPPVLDQFGLVGAIREYANSATDALAIRIDAPERLPALPAAVEVAAYRIALETIANVLRHANAKTCQLSLAYTKGEPPSLTLVISDDGVGIPNEHRAGVGLVSMRERAAELGGMCTIERSVSGGTRVVAVLPARQHASEAD